jgi:hypothetical protein
MSQIMNPDKSDLQHEFIELVKAACEPVTSKKWVYLNNLWYETSYRKKCTEIVTRYLGLITSWPSNKILLYLDGVPSNYGVLPLLGECASAMDCKLAIWRELGQIILAEPWLLPPKLSMHLDCVVFQDVTRHGTTLLKAIDVLSRVEWTVSHFVCLIQASEEKERIEESLSLFRKSKVCASDFQFDSLIDSSSLSPS